MINNYLRYHTSPISHILSIITLCCRAICMQKKKLYVQGVEIYSVVRRKEKTINTIQYKRMRVRHGQGCIAIGRALD